MSVQLLSLAIAPVLAIMIFVYRRDKYEKEPRLLLSLAFLCGMISMIPAALIESFIERKEGLLETLKYSIAGVGLVEEGCKAFFLAIFYRRKEFNEPFDGIVYAVMVSMGFAALENVFYVYEGGIGVALIRMFTAVPAHASFAVIMGYFWGLAKYRDSAKIPMLIGGLLFASLFHGAYDFCLLQKEIPLITLGALISLIVSVYLSFRAMKLHQQASPYKAEGPLE